jgi:hypothetical protein
MPKSMSVMGTIELEKIWTYLRRVTSEATHERIYVFQFNPATKADVDGYKFFHAKLNRMKWVAVIADAPDSKLPWSFKDVSLLARLHLNNVFLLSNFDD